MAKVIAPFKIVGTLDELVFYVDQENKNLVKTKGNPGITKKQFAENPIFQKVKNHGVEFGSCAKKSQNFRFTALQFFNRAKDGSFAGRTNKLMLEILNEDTIHPHGQRTVEEGMQVEDSKTYFIGFEGNKLRPLKTVLKTKYSWNSETSEFSIKAFNPAKNIDWPETAEQVHIAIARSNWDYILNKYTTEYSEEIIIKKEEKTTSINLKTNIPRENQLQLVFLYIGFSIQNRKNFKELKRSNNTVSIIWSE